MIAIPRYGYPRRRAAHARRAAIGGSLPAAWVPERATQPAQTTAQPSRTARPTCGGHEHSRDPSAGSNHGPAAAWRCCRQLARIAKQELVPNLCKSLCCVLSLLCASMVALQFGISFLSF